MPRNEFDGTDREELLERISTFVEELGPDQEEEAIELSPPGNQEAREFREDLIGILEARQESTPMVTRAAVIKNLKKSLER